MATHRFAWKYTQRVLVCLGTINLVFFCYKYVNYGLWADIALDFHQKPHIFFLYSINAICAMA